MSSPATATSMQIGVMVKPVEGKSSLKTLDFGGN
jgi:hypothetical protein